MRPFFFLLLLTSLFSLSHTTAARTFGAHHLTDGSAVIRELNLARQHPAIYADYLAKLLPRFSGNLLLLPGHSPQRTHEGAAAVSEAIQFLRKAEPLPGLVRSRGISLAAADHVDDQSSGNVGHNGSDRSDAGDRMNRHGTWLAFWGEDISYGRGSAREVVMALIVDDGLRGRQHRQNLFSPTFNYVGAAVGAHARYRTVCSIDLAGGYVEAGRGGDSLLARN